MSSNTIKSNKSSKEGYMNKFLKFIERLGNKLPHPFFMFMYITMFIAFLSFIFGFVFPVSFEAYDREGDLQTVEVVNMLSSYGIKWFFENMISNFLSVSSIGTIVMTVTTVYVAEKVGLMGYMIKKMVKFIPKKAITPAVIFIGIMSSIASDAGYIVLVPLGALIFYSYGKHPLAGIAAAFAGVSGGFSANLLVGPVDALVAGIATDLAPAGAPAVAVTTHWFFLIASTITLTLIGWFVTAKFVEPLLGEFNGKKPEGIDATGKITPEEKKAARAALIAFGVWVLVLVLLSLDPLWALFSDGTAVVIGDNEFMRYAPLGVASQYGGRTYGFMIAIVPIISLSFLIPGIAYGKSIGYIKENKDIYAALVDGFKQTVPILVIIFWIGQFIKIFSESNIDQLVAVKMAAGLESLGVTNSVVLLILFILLVATINILISGLSTKLYLIGPVFIPALFQLGIDPEWTILAYRVADSSTNIIAPLMSYMPIIVVFSHQWIKENEREDFGVGSIMSMMMPYSIFFLLTSTLLLFFFYVTTIPTGF